MPTKRKKASKNKRASIVKLREAQGQHPAPQVDPLNATLAEMAAARPSRLPDNPDPIEPERGLGLALAISFGVVVFIACVVIWLRWYAR